MEATVERLVEGDQPVDQKRDYVRQLFDEIDVARGVKESLEALLAEPHAVDAWRQAVIEYPDIIDYCWGRHIRWYGDGNIYLM